MAVPGYRTGLIVFLAAFIVCHVQTFKIAISHFNDINGQLDSFRAETINSPMAPTPCSRNQSDPQGCIGGLANIIQWIADNETFGYGDLPDSDKNFLRLFSGNFNGGESGWVRANSNPWPLFGSFVQQFRINVAALGMRDFGAGVQKTFSYINATGPSWPPPEFRGWPIFSVVNTCEGNFDNETSPDEFKFCNGWCNEDDICHYVQNVKKLEVDGDLGKYTIGVIGFVTPLVERHSLPGNLKFVDVADKIKQVADNNSDIKTFIALGDGDLETAKEILDKVPQVKMVIFGSAFSETVLEEYPLTYKQRLIATAGRFGSKVGKLVLNVDAESGDMTFDRGQLVNTTFPKPSFDYNVEAKNAIVRLTTDWRPSAVSKESRQLGFTRVHLDGKEKCWREECPLGNLLADAVVQCAARMSNQIFPQPIFSIWHGGAFYGGSMEKRSNISALDVLKWLPYQTNKVHLVKVTGANLMKLFETSAFGLDPKNGEDWGQFLQVSHGIQVYYNTESGTPKVEHVRILHDEGSISYMRDLREDKNYTVAIPTYLKEGRGNYEFARTIWTDADIRIDEFSEVDCLTEYINFVHQISVGNDDRIWINSQNNFNGVGKSVIARFELNILALICIFYTLSVSF